MTCPRCGGEVPDGSHYCNHCGGSTEGRIYVSPAETTEKAARAPNRPASILIALVLILAGIVTYRLLKSPPEVRAPVENGAHPGSTEPKSAPDRTPSAPKEGSLTESGLTPAEFTVGPAGLRYFKIVVDEQMKNASLVGTFKASGGAYDDIEVYVIGPDPSVNPARGNYAKSLYNSRRVTSRDLDVPLTSGEYYLLFSNMWSPSNKTISANVTLRSQSR